MLETLIDVARAASKLWQEHKARQADRAWRAALDQLEKRAALVREQMKKLDPMIEEIERINRTHREKG